MTPKGYSEDGLIERPAIELFKQLGWSHGDCFREFDGATKSPLGRDTDHEVVLVARLLVALRRLNSGIPDENLNQAVDEFTRDRSAMSAARANQEIYKLLKEGFKVDVRRADGTTSKETVAFIDWRAPKNNDFFLASQLWISGDMYRRRSDLIGFVNGIPLVFIELKATHKRLEDAFQKNLRDYKSTIPQVFWYNAFVILSNGSLSRIGSSTAPWEHFSEWKKINDEGEEGVVSLETIIRGTCDPVRLLDLIENFTLFEESKGGLAKIVAKSHQYLGVNRAIRAVAEVRDNKGRLGVFWHTQGSGKSYSMVFFSQKIMRTMPGNWTFAIVTDRQELDDQIHKSFVACGAVRDKGAQATSGDHLKQLLMEDHRYVFTLIQKFRTERGQTYPVLSTRNDIIVITDEAHRSQYDIFATNMRSALPKAAFIGFTGTPLMTGEEKTREVFGDYVSVYNFRQSIDDGATVPLYYENRIPELQLTNQDLNEDIYRVVEEAELDEAQEERLARELARQYHLITRDDRLERVAQDIVLHFAGRGYRGKAMVVCIDKATAVRIYDKVKRYWAEHLVHLGEKMKTCSEAELKMLRDRLDFLSKTDMAVVVSQSQNELNDMQAKGLDIRVHRARMVKEDLDTKFKDADDPLRLVFVCAMWMTGFDVPSCSTIYLDKPMRNHSLMQTIARANRVFGTKANGLIVDYVGVFRNLQKALAIYAAPTGGNGDSPIQSKTELVEALRRMIADAVAFCSGYKIDPSAIRAAQGFQRVRLLDDAVEAIIVSDAEKRTFLQLAGSVARLYRAILPDPSAGQFEPIAGLLAVLAEKIRNLTPQADISAVMSAIELVLDESIATDGYVIEAPVEGTEYQIDLGKIDFEKLARQFATSRKRTEVEKLRALVEQKLQVLVARNRSRMDYLERFQRLIEEYNAGSRNVEEMFRELLDLAQSLNQEEKRSIAENLTEEELALFDLLTKPDPKLTKQEEADVKKVVRSLLEKLKHEKLVLDWRKRQQTREGVRLCIQEELDQLPSAYTPPIYERKCDLAYRHVFDAYLGEGNSIYSDAS